MARGSQITKTRGENIRGFKILNVAPTGLVVRIRGGNGTGKSDMFLAHVLPINPKAVDGDVLTYGQKEGMLEQEITLDNGKVLRFLRTWKTTKAGEIVTKITVKQFDGEDVLRVDDVPELLNKMFGPFTDLRKFLAVRTPTQERELGDALLKSGGVDVKALDAELVTLLDSRKTSRAKLESAQARLDAIPIPRPGLPDAEQSVAGKAAEIAAWSDQRRAHAAAAAKLQGVANAVEEAAATVSRLRLQLDEAEKAQKVAVKRLDDEREAFDKLPAPPTEEEITQGHADLGKLEETNGRVRQAAAWRELKGEVATLEAEHAGFEAEIERVRGAKLAALRGAKMPIEDLAVNEEGSVTYKGIGLHELSEGQRLLVGVAIALATMGSVRSIFMDGGESIDEENEAKAIAMCEAANVRLWIFETSKQAAELVMLGADGSWERAEIAAADS